MQVAIWTAVDCSRCEKALKILVGKNFPNMQKLVEMGTPNIDVLVDFAEHDKNPTSMPLIRFDDSTGKPVLWLDGEDVEKGMLAIIRRAEKKGILS